MSEPILRLRSVKMDCGKVEIAAIETHQATSDEKEILLKSDEAPRPNMPDTLAQLAHDVRRLLELPSVWAKDALAVKKVVWSLSEKTGVRGATICCQAKLSCADAPLVFNTPHLPFEQYSDGGNAPLMPDDIIERLETLELAALDFLAGKRAQLSIFDRLDEMQAEDRAREVAQ